MLIMSMSESLPEPKATRPGFLSHFVHHSTFSRGSHSSLMSLLPSCIGCKSNFHLKHGLKWVNSQGKCEAYSLWFFCIYQGVERLRNRELISVSRLAFLLILYPPQNRDNIIVYLKDEFQELKAKTDREKCYIKNHTDLQVHQTQKKCSNAENGLNKEIEVSSSPQPLLKSTCSLWGKSQLSGLSVVEDRRTQHCAGNNSCLRKIFS